MDAPLFPKNFVWGTAVASHQVEGNADTQWDKWEQGRGPDMQAGRAVEHYERYQDDFKLLEELHCTAFRFSVEWSRIEPQPGHWDEAAIEHYRQYIAALRERGIEPFLTIFHFSLPRWFAAKGGFTRRRNLVDYERFVTKLAAEFGQQIRFVMPVNEPNVYSLLSYLIGRWPPQHYNPLEAYAVMKNLMAAHMIAYTAFKAINPAVSVGTAVAQSHETGRLLGSLTAWLSRHLWDHWYLDHIKDQTDFIGINYYFTNHYAWYGGPAKVDAPTNDMGWPMEPANISLVIDTVWRRYRKPVYVTENGLADATDTYRHWWLNQTLASLETSLRNGADLRGYFHWSLLDNFEWADGWHAKFGLVAVDRRTMVRTIRPSADWYSEQIKRYTGMHD